MSTFTDFDSLAYLSETDKWMPTEPMPFYLLWPTGPTLVVPTGFKAEYSDYNVRWTRRFSGLTDQQLAKGAVLHDYALLMGSRHIVASAVLYEALRVQGGSFLYCVGAFIGSWIVTSS
jgi:hypothetical protein